jgi:hypothetical protein
MNWSAGRSNTSNWPLDRKNNGQNGMCKAICATPTSHPDWLGHVSITHTKRYTALSPTRFKGFWRD